MPVSFIYGSYSCTVTLGMWSLELLCLPLQPPWLITCYSLVACHSSDFSAGRLPASELQILFIRPPRCGFLFQDDVTHLVPTLPQFCLCIFQSVSVSQTFIFSCCYYDVDRFFSNTGQIRNRIEIAALEVIYQL